MAVECGVWCFKNIYAVCFGLFWLRITFCLILSLCRLCRCFAGALPVLCGPMHLPHPTHRLGPLSIHVTSDTNPPKMERTVFIIVAGGLLCAWRNTPFRDGFNMSRRKIKMTLRGTKIAQELWRSPGNHLMKRCGPWFVFVGGISVAENKNLRCVPFVVSSANARTSPQKI